MRPPRAGAVARADLGQWPGEPAQAHADADEGDAAEDYDMWLRITARFPVTFIERQLIIKRGGHPDQLSRAYDGMDRFRIASIVKVLDSGALSHGQTRKAIEELRAKCRIYGVGAMKRGKKEEGERYLKLASVYEERATPGKQISSGS